MPNYLRAYCVRSSEEDTGPIRFVASTANVARDGMIIEADGWQLDNYRKNPVLLWAHDYIGQSLPIGRTEVSIEEGNLIANATFDQQDEFARQVESKYRRGFLHAVSVGWNILEFEPGKNENIRGRVTKSELLDVSAVPVPADPDALMERQARALADLSKAFNHLTDDRAVTPKCTAVFRGVAAAMAALYLDSGGVGDDDRKAIYNSLERVYRKFDKTPPEFRPGVELAALGDVELRGLFLEGEPEFLPAIFERKGAVLSARNRGDLDQAITLIQGVLERAKKEEPPEEERTADMVELPLDDAQLLNLRLLLAQMEK